MACKILHINIISAGNSNKNWTDFHTYVCYCCYQRYCPAPTKLHTCWKFLTRSQILILMIPNPLCLPGAKGAKWHIFSPVSHSDTVNHGHLCMSKRADRALWGCMSSDGDKQTDLTSSTGSDLVMYKLSFSLRDFGKTSWIKTSRRHITLCHISQTFCSGVVSVLFVFCSVRVLHSAMVSSFRGFWVKRERLWMCVRYRHKTNTKKQNSNSDYGLTSVMALSTTRGRQSTNTTTSTATKNNVQRLSEAQDTCN